MEDLTKQQIVLVSLLVSFVTSIATGIITVSMINQAPQNFTQTVNKVVERTIERVVPDASLVKTIEQKVITQEDQFASAASIALESSAKIISPEGEVVAIGPVISKDGKVLTKVFPGKYSIVYSDDKKFSANISSSTPSFTILEPIIPDENKKTVKFSPLDFSKKSDIKAGKTIVVISGKENLDVFKGIIQNASSTEGIKTSLNSENLKEGAFIVDLTGDLVSVNIQGAFVDLNELNIK